MREASIILHDGPFPARVLTHRTAATTTAFKSTDGSRCANADAFYCSRVPAKGMKNG
jgi:hypothetical protein